MFLILLNGLIKKIMMAIKVIVLTIFDTWNLFGADEEIFTL